MPTNAAEALVWSQHRLLLRRRQATAIRRDTVTKFGVEHVPFGEHHAACADPVDRGMGASGHQRTCGNDCHAGKPRAMRETCNARASPFHRRDRADGPWQHARGRRALARDLVQHLPSHSDHLCRALAERRAGPGVRAARIVGVDYCEDVRQASHATALNRSNLSARRSRSGRSLMRPGRWIVPPFNRFKASRIGPSFCASSRSDTCSR